MIDAAKQSLIRAVDRFAECRYLEGEFFAVEIGTSYGTSAEGKKILDDAFQARNEVVRIVDEVFKQ